MAQGGHDPANASTRCIVGFSDVLDWRPLSFLDATIAEEACGLCGRVSKMAVQLPCGHLLCTDCHPECVQQGSVCPLDQRVFSDGDLIRHQLLSLDNYRVACCNARHGCEFVGTATSLIDHYKQCGFHVVTCQRCHSTMLRTAIVSHCKGACSALPTAVATPQRRSSRSRDSVERKHDELKAMSDNIFTEVAKLRLDVSKATNDIRLVDGRVEWWWKNNCTEIRNLKSFTSQRFTEGQAITEKVSADIIDAVRAARCKCGESVVWQLDTDTEKVLKAVNLVSNNLYRFCGHTVYHWYLSGWKSLTQTARGGSVAISSSPRWMAYGYCVSINVSLEKDENKRLSVTCFFNVHPGGNDPQLEWPFSKVFEYGIIHPTDGLLTIGHKTDPWFHKDHLCFQRPMAERRAGFAKQALSTAEKFEVEDYVRDDMVHMFLQVDA